MHLLLLTCPALRLCAGSAPPSSACMLGLGCVRPPRLSNTPKRRPSGHRSSGSRARLGLLALIQSTDAIIFHCRVRLAAVAVKVHINI